ncbi:hypothetical protein HRbin41_01521 [bacterium HR41]|nr:hypothetical protein HRbin41_01521 [bacterium HR41]
MRARLARSGDRRSRPLQRRACAGPRRRDRPPTRARAGAIRRAARRSGVRRVPLPSRLWRCGPRQLRVRRVPPALPRRSPRRGGACAQALFSPQARVRAFAAIARALVATAPVMRDHAVGACLGHAPFLLRPTGLAVGLALEVALRRARAAIRPLTAGGLWVPRSSHRAARGLGLGTTSPYVRRLPSPRPCRAGAARRLACPGVDTKPKRHSWPLRAAVRDRRLRRLGSR